MKIELANFLLEESCAFFEALQLYVHAGGRMDRERDGWHLASSSKYDFTAFFDVLLVKRYSECTPAHSYLLHLEINGKTAIFQTAANACDYVPQRDGRIIEANGDSWGAIDILLAYDPSDIPCDFVIAAASPVILRNSYRCAEVVDEGIHPVELVLSTTAFKKESYIIHNIGLVSKAILGSDEDIAKHSRVYAVDNGRMLGAQKLSGGKVTVSPNRNIDGASGFACGRQGSPLPGPDVYHPHREDALHSSALLKPDIEELHSTLSPIGPLKEPCQHTCLKHPYPTLGSKPSVTKILAVRVPRAQGDAGVLPTISSEEPVLPMDGSIALT